MYYGSLFYDASLSTSIFRYLEYVHLTGVKTARHFMRASGYAIGLRVCLAVTAHDFLPPSTSYCRLATLYVLAMWSLSKLHSPAAMHTL